MSKLTKSVSRAAKTGILGGDSEYIITNQNLQYDDQIVFIVRKNNTTDLKVYRKKTTNTYTGPNTKANLDAALAADYTPIQISVDSTANVTVAPKWISGTPYLVNEEVSFGGNIYKAKGTVANLTLDPSANTAEWETVIKISTLVQNIMWSSTWKYDSDQDRTNYPNSPDIVGDPNSGFIVINDTNNNYGNGPTSSITFEKTDKKFYYQPTRLALERTIKTSYPATVIVHGEIDIKATPPTPIGNVNSAGAKIHKYSNGWDSETTEFYEYVYGSFNTGTLKFVNFTVSNPWTFTKSIKRLANTGVTPKWSHYNIKALDNIKAYNDLNFKTWNTTTDKAAIARAFRTQFNVKKIDGTMYSDDEIANTNNIVGVTNNSRVAAFINNTSGIRNLVFVVLG